ncbi:MAG TPA: hypothetical protein VNC41_13405 [Acidimicrobiia bacterium]|nr:hypothetical protein [Acidimicrobiia bacterium]
MLEFDPLDEYPIHQVALPMRYTGTSDRNFYDRAIYQGVDHEADAYFITGLGVYPNLGIIDAYATVRRGDRQWAIRASGSRPDDKMKQEVGPYKVEVIEPFKQIRITCDGDKHGLGFDLTYRSDYGPISEPAHVRRQGDVILLDASRFAGVGTWEGELRVDGETIAVTPERFTATRDRSWGIRPVGEPMPAGKPVDFTGMWWCWVPLKFDDFAMHIMVEEDRSGSRNTNFAVRVWPEATGKPMEQLGWPLPQINYEKGTRNPLGASFDLTTRDGKTSTLEVEPLIGIPLNVGCGYGADPEWTHGLWKGDDWVESSVYSYSDPEVTGRAAFSLWDHVAKVRFEGHEGYGIFEHGALGPHAPSGFTDFMDGAQ